MISLICHLLIATVVLVFVILLFYPVYWFYRDKIKKQCRLPFHIITPISKPHPSGLKNNSTGCYMNSIIHAVASSDKLIEQFTEIQLKYPYVESLNLFVELLQNVNTSDYSYDHLCKNTDLLEILIKLVHWTKPSQHDAFELLFALVNGIHRDLESLNFVNFQYEMPMKYKMVYRFTGISIPNKIQNSLGLSLGLSGDYSTNPGVTIEHQIDECFQPSIIDDDPNKTFQIFLYRKAPYVLLLHIQTNKWDNSRVEMIKPEYHIQYNKIKAVVQHMGYIGGGYCVT